MKYHYFPCSKPCSQEKRRELGNKAGSKDGMNWAGKRYYRLCLFYNFFPLMIHKVERLCKEVPIDNPSKCPCAEEWDGMTLETWKHQTLWTNGEKCVWVSQVVTICTLGTVISLSLKLTYANYLNLEGKLYWNPENHEIYMAQYPCISRKEWFAC